MFFAQAESITNQTVAVTVLIMILGGLGWLVKQIFSMLPSLMDRLDKQEDKRCQAMEKLVSDIRASNSELAGRFEKAIENMCVNFNEHLNDIHEAIEEQTRMNALRLAGVAEPEPDNGKATINTTAKKGA